MDNRTIAHIVETYYATVLFPVLGEAEDTVRSLIEGLVSTLEIYTLPPQEEGERYAQGVVYPLIGQSNIAERLTQGLITILEKNTSEGN